MVDRDASTFKLASFQVIQTEPHTTLEGCHSAIQAFTWSNDETQRLQIDITLATQTAKHWYVVTILYYLLC